jgi:hypothetical protein
MSLDVVEDIGSSLGSCLVVLPVHAFPFERPEKSLGRGIVGATPHRTQAGDHVVRLQEPLVFLGRKLTAPMRVQDNWSAGGPLP